MNKKIIEIVEEVDIHNPKSSFDLINSKKNVVNSISPTFCLAKWLQSTVLLQNGETHSCHHPARHKIHVDHIKDNPAGIHNTPIKLKARQDMLSGVQTKECHYCWSVENLDTDHISDRIYKSSFSWSWPHLQKVLDNGLGIDINPTYLEISFENTCNFKCIYCSPESSSRWQEEVSNHGGIQLSNFVLNDPRWLKDTKRWPIRHDEYNPYIEAFWKWWPILYPDLHTFRITGGEPLLSKHTWTVLDYIKKHPHPNLSLAINTNLNAPNNLVDKLLNYIQEITPHIKSFQIYTSIESSGDQAEYTRSGLDYNQFLENVYKILDTTENKVELHFMTTVNVLSASTFVDFLDLMQSLKKKYQISKHNYRIQFRVNYLTWPKCLSIGLLSQEDKEHYKKIWLDFANSHTINWEKYDFDCFNAEDLAQISRLCDYMVDKTPNLEDYNDFRLFISECDLRRNTNFVNVFPDLHYLLNSNYYGKQL
jgi:pyruvate-formate lyase-activating enzyme